MPVARTEPEAEAAVLEAAPGPWAVRLRAHKGVLNRLSDAELADLDRYVDECPGASRKHAGHDAGRG
jgi:hypothetical protein